MKPLAQVAAVQAADAVAQREGIPVAVLMGRAGAAVARAAAARLGSVAGRRVVALAGKGHNGGDALEALARLAGRGAGAEALVTADPDGLDEQGRRCVALVRAAGGRVRRFDPALAGRLLGGADLVVDGLLGTGSSGAPRGATAEAIAAANAAGAPVVAVDIPSGVDGATGEVAGEAVTAVVTVTFQAAKPGHVLAPGSGHVGRLEVADIGLPLQPGDWWVSEAADLAGLVPVPRAELHKRSRGVLLLVGGSPGMGGAPTLMGLAARRSGTGLLVLAVPASVADRVGAAVPEALTVALPESGGGLAAAADNACRRWLGEATAIGVGPGLGRADGTQKVVRGLLAAYRGPAVVDADALFALGTGGPLAERAAPTLVTPHAGEFARLAPDAEGTRLDRAADRAAAWRATVLLKGDHTVVADPDGRLAVNPTGVPALATGGTGDVLTGLAGALLAQGLAPFDAARLGAWVHGRAGALAARSLGPVSVAAGDVAEHLPAAFGELLAEGPGNPATAGGGAPRNPPKGCPGESAEGVAVSSGGAWPGLRPAWVEVDLDAVAGNVHTLAGEVAPARLLAVVKADAYGHGAVPVARKAIGAGAAWLGVALVEEALGLREAGVSAPVLVLSEPHPAAADACAAQGLAVTICTQAGVRAFGAAARRAGRPVAVHLKVDTGMHRQGCAPAELPALVAAALAEPGLEVEGLWSHFAVADEAAKAATTDAQLARFHEALAAAAAAGLRPRWRHLANSAGATVRDDARFDLVRVGIELYGLAPSAELAGHVRARLRPALALRAAVSALRTVEAGERVSYGHRWEARRPTRIATLPVGYADGVRRGLSGRIRVRLGGRILQQVGTVTMDQMMVDVDDADVEVGQVATLLGDPAEGEPGVGEWAAALDTIDYEVTCGLSMRLPRVHRHGLPAGRQAGAHQAAR